MNHIGIDPGASGAVALLDGLLPNSGSEIACLDTSDPVAVADTLRRLSLRGSNVLVAIERNHSMPKMGCAAAFTFGTSWGIVRGACAALALPVVLVSAQKWRAFALEGRGVPAERKDRDAATVRAAMERWPYLEWPKAKKAREGVAAALFIAAYAARDSRQKETA